MRIKTANGIRRAFAVLPILLIMLACFAFTSFAEEEKRPTIYVEVGMPDENGVFELTVSGESMHFMLYELAFKYDTTAVVPFGENENAKSFDGFATLSSFDGVSYIGKELDGEKGYFLYTGFVNPMISGENISNGMIYFGEKTALATFTFRKISDGDPAFEIASIYNGDVYSEFFPDGAVVISSLSDEKRYVCDILISYGDTEKKTESAYYYYSELYPKNYTKEQRLDGTVYLADGDYASAVDGVLRTIDGENHSVVPYVRDGVRYVPLRFVCESLGRRVEWADGVVTVTADDGKSISIDVYSEERAEIVCSRTMIDEGFLCDILGVRSCSPCDGEVIIYDSIVEWTPEREAETLAYEAMKSVLSPLFRIFV